MHYLVTGGAGFVGSHLCERLLDDGGQVTAVDNFITGSSNNLAHLTSRDGFSFIQADVTKPIAVGGPIDAILHLASPASPRGYLENPLETALVNTIGTNLMLGLALERGAKFLLASTSEAYGDPLEHPQREEYWGNVNPVGVRSCYDEGKRFAEALTMVYVRKYSLDARIVRIFNTYGPRSAPDDGRLVPNFVTQALRGPALTVYGDGSQTRSLCYVSDLVDGLIRALGTPGTTGQVYNLGNPDERTVLDFARLIKTLSGSEAPIEFRQHISTDDPQRRCPDITRARQVLGWEPRVSTEHGLSQTIAWFRERLAVGSAHA